jgi:hypothetical protein
MKGLRGSRLYAGRFGSLAATADASKALADNCSKVDGRTDNPGAGAKPHSFA